MSPRRSAEQDYCATPSEELFYNFCNQSSNVLVIRTTNVELITKILHDREPAIRNEAVGCDRIYLLPHRATVSYDARMSG